MLSSDKWQYSVADFNAMGNRCVSFDRRGHGRSERPRDGYVFERLVDDLAAVIEHLDLRDITLIGHSLGGAEAMGYVARHGTGRVARLVLISAATPLLLETDDNPAGIDPNAVAAVRAAWIKDFPRWVRERADAFYRPAALGVHAGIVDWTMDMMSAPIQVALACGRIVIETEAVRAARARLQVHRLRRRHVRRRATWTAGSWSTNARKANDCAWRRARPRAPRTSRSSRSGRRLPEGEPRSSPAEVGLALPMEHVRERL
jgi:pimeloyl-ACP methyl ester carboxylesterase